MPEQKTKTLDERMKELASSYSGDELLYELSQHPDYANWVQTQGFQTPDDILLSVGALTGPEGIKREKTMEAARASLPSKAARGLTSAALTGASFGTGGGIPLNVLRGLSMLSSAADAPPVISPENILSLFGAGAQGARELLPRAAKQGIPYLSSGAKFITQHPAAASTAEGMATAALGNKLQDEPPSIPHMLGLGALAGAPAFVSSRLAKATHEPGELLRRATKEKLGTTFPISSGEQARLKRDAAKALPPIHPPEVLKKLTNDPQGFANELVVQLFQASDVTDFDKLDKTIDAIKNSTRGMDRKHIQTIRAGVVRGILDTLNNPEAVEQTTVRAAFSGSRAEKSVNKLFGTKTNVYRDIKALSDSTKVVKQLKDFQANAGTSTGIPWVSIKDIIYILKPQTIVNRIATSGDSLAIRELNKYIHSLARERSISGKLSTSMARELEKKIIRAGGERVDTTPSWSDIWKSVF